VVDDGATRTVHPRDDADDTAHALPPNAIARRRAAPPVKYTLATLRHEEIRSARTMIRVGRWIGVAVLIALPLVGGDRALAIAFAISIALAITVGAVVDVRLRDPARYRETTMLVLAASVLPAGFCGVVYWGIFSAAQLFPVLSLYFFSRRERFASALSVYLGIAVGQLLIAIALISGLVSDPGLFEPDLPRSTLVIGHALVQVGDFAAFVLGLRSFRATQAALDDMQSAMVLAARREALLREARQDLERAIRGGPGRYTDQTFGSFRLGNVLGRGGMGEVYEARHVDSDAPAAVKLLPARELGNPRSVERFVREVRAASALRSPYAVRVLAASGEHDPIPYLVMELLHGHDLAHLLRDDPRLPHDELVALLAQVGTALAEAWQLGIVHRDLKPHNLFRAESDGGRAWKVLDFGVAALADHSGTLTHGHVVGTPAYMAPEQARGEHVDHRADLYALAAIAYRCLTGRPVCSGPDMHASLYQIVHGAPVRPSAVAELPADVDAALAIGLAKDPVDRFDSAAELRDALADALAGTLDPELRDRAAGLVARSPWGTG
jgi:serine/threonine-protein kinase